MSKTSANLLHRSLTRASPSALCQTPFISTRRNGSNSSTWEGRKPDEHVNDRHDTQNVQVSASRQGKADRASGDSAASGATSQKDHGNQNKKAHEEHPEAPGPVIGMNDERGGVSNIGRSFCRVPDCL